MDIREPDNFILVTKIRQEALGNSLIEAYLESVPQLILQCSIIMRTGNASKLIFSLLKSSLVRNFIIKIISIKMCCQRPLNCILMWMKFIGPEFSYVATSIKTKFYLKTVMTPEA